MLLVWQTKRSCPSPSASQSLAGFVSEFLYILFLSHSADALHQSLTLTSSHPRSLPAIPPPAQPPLPVINVHAEATFGKQKAGDDESNVPGERPGARKLSIKGQHDRQRRKRKDSSPHHSAGSGPSTPGSAAEDGGPQQPSNIKRLKTTTTEGEAPSLLLRMGHAQHLSVPARGRKTSKSRSPPEVQSQRSDSSGRPPAGLPDLSLGISIKGAARSHSHSHPHSLLERIQGSGT